MKSVSWLLFHERQEGDTFSPASSGGEWRAALHRCDERNGIASLSPQCSGEGTFSERQIRYKTDSPRGMASYRQVFMFFPAVIAASPSPDRWKQNITALAPEGLRSTFRSASSSLSGGELNGQMSVRSRHDQGGGMSVHQRSCRRFEIKSPQFFWPPGGRCSCPRESSSNWQGDAERSVPCCPGRRAVLCATRRRLASARAWTESRGTRSTGAAEKVNSATG